MKRWGVISGGAAIVVVTLGWLGSSYLAGMRNAEFWESTIAGFEELDRANPPEPGAILFTGSSSIVMWETLARDMSPLRVLNRGFGGSQIDHVSHYVTRVVHPYRPSAVVLYAGDNDLASGTGKTAESVFADFREFVRLVHAELPGVPIYFIAIKPSTLRWDRWPIMSDANGRIAKWSGETDDVDYIDIATPMLGESGEPDSELFLLDGLHLSEEGYALWTGVVKPFLVERHGS